MWTVVYISKNAEDIKNIEEALKTNQIIYRFRKKEDFFELLVPSMELSSAHSIILDNEI